MCFAPQRRALFRHFNFQTWGVLYIFTSTCASRHSGVHFFDISTSKHGVFCTFLLPHVLRATTACTFSTSQLSNMVYFVRFDFHMCFAPQRRALFRHPNFQKYSETDVFGHFWLSNLLRVSTVCAFSTSQLPKVVRAWCVLTLFTSKCASRHNGV